MDSNLGGLRLRPLRPADEAAVGRRGYATQILRQSVIIARSVGVDRVLVTCDDSHLGSAAVIERCGGRLDSVNDVGVRKVRRYWID
jgi:predicted acetyltransferase